MIDVVFVAEDQRGDLPRQFLLGRHGAQNLHHEPPHRSQIARAGLNLAAAVK